MSSPRRVLLVFALVFSWTGVADAQIIFNFTYQDAPGTGFNAAGALGQTRRDTLQLVADYIGATVSTPGPRTVNIDVLPSNTLPGVPWLAVAGVLTVPVDFTFNRNLVMQVVQTGFNPGPGAVGALQWNFGPDITWGYGTTVTVPDFDFQHTALHELTHHLGWFTRMTATGASASGTAAYAYYDQFVQGWNGSSYVSFVNTTAGNPSGTTISPAALTNTTNPLRFSGPFANAAGGPFGLATLSTFQPGTSVGHLGVLTDVMGGFAAPGQGFHTYSPTDIAVLRDLGYNFSTAGLIVVQSGGSTIVAEGGATDTFTVALQSAPTANVTVTLNPGTQVTVAPATLTFTPTNWNTAQTVTVTAVDDALVEGAHTGTIAFTVTSTDTAYNAITVPSVSVNIADNDGVLTGLTIVESGGSTAVTEGSGPDTFTVTLKSAPTANVTVTLNGGTQVTVAPASLTFTSANWNVPQTVTVTAIDDAVPEGPHAGFIAFTTASTDPLYNALAVPSVNVLITDNDGAPPIPPTPPSPPAPGEGSYGDSGSNEGSFRALAGPFLEKAGQQSNWNVFNVRHKQRAHLEGRSDLGPVLGWTLASGLALAAALVFGKRKKST
jgi:hypothetical protein